MAGMSLVAAKERQIMRRAVGQLPANRPEAALSSNEAPSTDGNINDKGGRTMFLTQKFIVRKHEGGLLFKDGDFIKFLAPGTYRYYGLIGRYEVECFDLSKPQFEHARADYLLAEFCDDTARRLHIVETGDSEVAVVYDNERAIDYVAPADRRLYWKGVIRVRVERIALDGNLALDARLARQLVVGPEAKVRPMFATAVYARVVPEGHVGLLYVDGELTDTLAAGRHAFWSVAQDVQVELVDLRIRALEIQGQEILTRDKVALRINVTATYHYTDAARAVRAFKDPLDQLYKEIQFGLRAAVGTRKLDVLLEDKTAIDHDIAEYLGRRFADFGVDVTNVGVKDIILPGDMKSMLARVVEAEKAAQANVIRRREETNATRSLLNTAKVMESNGVALRLRELETLEKVTENVGNLSVVGGLDALLHGLVKIKP